MALLALLAGRASAQQVVMSGHGDPAADRRIQAVLAAGSYRLIAHDTTIPAGDTVRGPVLVTGAILRLDGTIQGDLVGVASDLFIHPTGVVTGMTVNAGGGLYASAKARLGQTLDRPLTSYVVTRNPSLIRIDAREVARSRLALDQIGGVHVPTYDRVNGLWPQAGAALRLPAPAVLMDSARLHLVGGWRLAGPGATYTADLQLRRGRYAAILGEQRLSATQDRWIRGDISNTLSFLATGADYRDYYDARRTFAALARDFDAGRWGGHIALRAGREIDRSLRAHRPWVFFQPDSVRPNRPVTEGVITSGTLEAAAGWVGAGSDLNLGGEVERAGKTLGGDLPFTRFLVWTHAGIEALWSHTLQVDARLQGPLGGTSVLPPQRWSHVGGAGTLPSFPIAAFQGDHVAFVSTQYVMPLPGGLRLPLVGPPALALLHTAGMAWTQGESHRLEQNLGLEVRAFGLAIGAVTNPAHTWPDLRFYAGFASGTGLRLEPRPYFDIAAPER